MVFVSAFLKFKTRRVFRTYFKQFTVRETVALHCVDNDYEGETILSEKIQAFKIKVRGASFESISMRKMIQSASVHRKNMDCRLICLLSRTDNCHYSNGQNIVILINFGKI